MEKKVWSIDVGSMTLKEAEGVIERIKEAYAKRKEPAAEPARKGTAVARPIRSAAEPRAEAAPACPHRPVEARVKADDAQWLPAYDGEGAAFDLKAVVGADVNGNREVNLAYRSVVVLDCGFDMEIEKGYKAEVAATDSLASKGLVVLNSPGQVEGGRVRVVLGNVGKEIVKIRHGDKVAKAWAAPVYRFRFAAGGA